MSMRRHLRTRAQRLTAIAVGFLVVVPLMILIFGTIVKTLWNWLMPAIFHLPRLSLTQAIGLMVLSWILFGLRGMSGARAGGGRWRRELMHLTPEERERLLNAVEARQGERSPLGGTAATPE